MTSKWNRSEVHDIRNLATCYALSRLRWFSPRQVRARHTDDLLPVRLAQLLWREGWGVPRNSAVQRQNHRPGQKPFALELA